MFGLITGSGFYELPGLEGGEESGVATPYGEVLVTTGVWRGQKVAFLPRHESGHTVAPHRINYRANVWALHHVGVQVIVATAVSGGINRSLAPGQLVLISDFLEFTSGRDTTFFDGETDPGFEGRQGAVTHTDMTSPYHPDVRRLILEAAEQENVSIVDGGVYCTANGPRFETPAEITMMARAGGDLVGMTGYPEVALAVEAGIPYASIGVISNPAAGLGGEDLSIDDIYAVIEGASEPLYRLIGRTVELYADGTL